VLDYCRLHDITVQAWSPFQKPAWKGIFINDPEYPELNQVLSELAVTYDTTPTTLAAAWILRHPAGIQVITGTASEARLKEISSAEDVQLSREDWYRLYLAAGHILP
jgi:predicted oxidoreductase